MTWREWENIVFDSIDDSRDISPMRSDSHLLGENMDTTGRIRECFSWQPTRSGSYETDCEIGGIAACQIISLLRDSECPSLLGNFVNQIVGPKEWGGFEVGFMHTIAQAVRGVI